MKTIQQRLEQVLARIRDAERRYACPPGSVRLLAVSKRQDPAKLRAAFAAGQHAFGESYLQEALDKQDQLGDLAAQWHFIGRIQSNKTRQVAERFAWVHSLCDLKHARRLSAQRPNTLPPLKACVQVNLSGEPTKSGLAPESVAQFLSQCKGLPGVEVCGLMVLPAPAQSEAEQRRPFRELRELRDRLTSPDLPLATLSMGMSADLEAAIAEGASIVRVGTAVFGPRPQT